MATIKLRKPDLTGSSYPVLLMENASATFQKMEGEGDTGEFENNETYYGFLFNFGSFNDSEDEEILLDTDGLWEAIINVIKNDYDVQGVATFNVAGHGTEEASTISYDIITNQLVQNINRRALKTQTIITILNLSADVSDYNEGQMFYSLENRQLYRKINGELVSQVDSSFTIDGSLSPTSENPVQNKVIVEALQNVRAVAEGKCDTYVLSYNDTISSIKADVQAQPFRTNVINQNGRDITQEVLDGDYDDFDVDDSGEGYIFCNPLFNSNDGSVNISGMLYKFILRKKIIDMYGEHLSYMLYTFEYDEEPIWKIGDILYVVETDVPDRWAFGGKTFYELEGSAKRIYKHTITSTDASWTNLSLVIVNDSSIQGENVQTIDMDLIYNAKVISMYITGNAGLISPVIKYEIGGHDDEMILYYADVSGGNLVLASKTLYEFTITDTVSTI